MWVHNLGCEEAEYLDTWQNSDAGIQNMVEALFKMPLETVAAALQVDLSAAQVVHPSPPSSPPHHHNTVPFTFRF